MRPYLLLALPLLAGPLAAQGRPIAPAPSALFRSSTVPEAVADTVTPHTKMSTGEGALMGGLGGLLAGVALSKIVEATSPCSCEDPGLDRAVSYGLGGLLIGALIGGAMAAQE